MKSSCSFPKQAKPEILTNIARFALCFFTFLVTITLVLHLTSSHAYSAQATLEWDPNTDQDVTGYKVYYGPTSGNYTQSIDVGNVTTYILNNLTSGSTYYFAATCHDAAGNESPYSNEVSKTFPVYYSITTTSDINGAIIPSGNPPVSQGTDGSSVIKIVTVIKGSSQAFTITPNAGCHVVVVKADGKSLGAIKTYTFSNITADHFLDATFAIYSYSITSSAGTGGTISPTGTSTVNYDGSQLFSITPATGYHVAGVTVDGHSVGAVTSYTFNNVTANHRIAATFAINTYTVSASAGSGGRISPAGTSTVKYGVTKKFTITPATGYHVTGVTVDGNPVGAVTSYTFSKVTANHTIAATFAINTYTLSASAGSGGAISPDGTSTVNYGVTQKFTITPNTGYHVAAVTVDGRSVGAVTSYNFGKVIANHTIAATFAINTYTITASARTGGTISPKGTSKVNYGDSKTYTLSPNTGYKIKGVSVDGVSVGAVSTYTFSDVKAKHTIVATYAKI